MTTKRPHRSAIPTIREANRTNRKDKKFSCEFCLAVYALVRMIPHGLVSSYGDIARGLGYRTYARQVAYCLRAANKQEQRDLPWHRVVCGDMKIAFKEGTEAAKRQLLLLRQEGAMNETKIYRVPSQRRWQPYQK